MIKDTGILPAFDSSQWHGFTDIFCCQRFLWFIGFRLCDYFGAAKIKQIKHCLFLSELQTGCKESILMLKSRPANVFMNVNTALESMKESDVKKTLQMH